MKSPPLYESIKSKTPTKIAIKIEINPNVLIINLTEDSQLKYSCQEKNNLKLKKEANPEIGKQIYPPLTLHSWGGLGNVPKFRRGGRVA
tara:strand:- start:50 stop:316 length:267 start_codon:yes stop_codon:yes gene_type:complete